MIRENGQSPKTFEQAISAVLAEMRQIMLAKRHDYGPSNISAFGEAGVLVRAGDKLSRLKNLLWDNPGDKPKNESIEDSWLDLANYSVLAIMARRGWVELPIVDQKEDDHAS